MLSNVNLQKNPCRNYYDYRKQMSMVTSIEKKHTHKNNLEKIEMVTIDKKCNVMIFTKSYAHHHTLHKTE